MYETGRVALEMIVFHYSTGPFDVARVETGGQIDYCVTLVGWAGVADINCKAERLRMLGSPRSSANDQPQTSSVT